MCVCGGGGGEGVWGGGGGGGVGGVWVYTVCCFAVGKGIPRLGLTVFVKVTCVSISLVPQQL